MRKALLAAAMALLIVPGVVSAQQRANCQQLLAACQNKDRLGEQGEGNCRQYREQCQRQPQRQPTQRDRYCAELRQGCLDKERLGEQGAGNCERYRHECRGRP